VAIKIISTIAGLIAIACCIFETAPAAQAQSIGVESWGGTPAPNTYRSWQGSGAGVTIGPDSCQNIGSCTNLGPNVTIGAGACNGDDACQYAGYNGVAQIGDNSCDGDEACEQAGQNGSFIEGSSSRPGSQLRYWPGGGLACDNPGSCVGGKATIAINSCLGYQSGYHTGAEGASKIGSGSCASGDTPCCDAGDEGGSASIGNGSCNGDDARNMAGAEEGNFKVADGSCDGTKACGDVSENYDANVGANACDATQACQNAAKAGPANIASNTCDTATSCRGCRNNLAGCYRTATPGRDRC